MPDPIEFPNKICLNNCTCTLKDIPYLCNACSCELTGDESLPGLFSRTSAQSLPVHISVWESDSGIGCGPQASCSIVSWYIEYTEASIIC